MNTLSTKIEKSVRQGEVIFTSLNEIYIGPDFLEESIPLKIDEADYGIAIDSCPNLKSIAFMPDKFSAIGRQHGFIVLENLKHIKDSTPLPLFIPKHLHLSKMSDEFFENLIVYTTDTVIEHFNGTSLNAKINTKTLAIRNAINLATLAGFSCEKRLNVFRLKNAPLFRSAQSIPVAEEIYIEDAGLTAQEVIENLPDEVINNASIIEVKVNGDLVLNLENLKESKSISSYRKDLNDSLSRFN